MSVSQLLDPTKPYLNIYVNGVSSATTISAADGLSIPGGYQLQGLDRVTIPASPTTYTALASDLTINPAYQYLTGGSAFTFALPTVASLTAAYAALSLPTTSGQSFKFAIYNRSASAITVSAGTDSSHWDITIPAQTSSGGLAQPSTSVKYYTVVFGPSTGSAVLYA